VASRHGNAPAKGELEKSCDIASNSFLSKHRVASTEDRHPSLSPKKFTVRQLCLRIQYHLHLLEEVETMSAEEVQSQSGFEDGLGGPGAPTPLSALEVHASIFASLASFQADILQGINGLTPRDIKLMTEAGYNTVESVAYTYDCLHLRRWRTFANQSLVREGRWNKSKGYQNKKRQRFSLKV